ncbi:MAG: TetM/TetW/TetO/TetS family tetracycline resistance ribosomal protection protein [Lachnospiraceae bacterium]|nr:TetM/TetW/TetO/TetS family tetracycline resistance ribosomal protection protein [Lachnospiraceae bacterium]MBR6350101.1 TetM/TetW/TetO/TetS family tetracycline resistance ribosomal protection protein [Lachnospiraceae bacterium]
MKKVTIGIIAHVDSGKTTLSEGLLYLGGTIRTMGRVDKGSSFLDSNSMERDRGITIYSKQARLTYKDTEFILIDTPGHADFSAEMERTMQVLDYAILLIAASDGIRGQTETLLRILAEYQVPTFIFINKMDQAGADAQAVLDALHSSFGSEIVDFSKEDGEAFFDQTAMCSEEAMEEFMDTGRVSEETICNMIADRQLIPCFFGSALKMTGVEEFLDALDRLTLAVDYPEEFAARVFKISRDESGERLTLLKVTGGELKSRTALPDGGAQNKINQIRIYNGTRYTLTESAPAGEICAVTGLKESWAGQGFGAESEESAPLLMPILNYRVILPEGEAPVKALPKFRTLEEENPELSVRWDEDRQEIYVCVMGEVQLEILSQLLVDRFGLEVSFDTGEVMYRETIARPVIGIGHFEPLRHYAEVHLLLEPLPEGSGLEFSTTASTDYLAKNWQRLILTHLAEKRHKGVLTGSPITDMRITLTAGRAHLKHTEGGDFRQAVYRAVRQGLMMAENVLLEPYYRFILEVPYDNVGRALNDLGQMNASFGAPELDSQSNMSVIRGRGPVSCLMDYPRELAAYTRGQGHITLISDGYSRCHNEEEVVLARQYDPRADLANSPDSVFCSHGSGVIIPYDEVYDHAHIAVDGSLKVPDDKEYMPERAGAAREINLGTEEIDRIIAGISRKSDSTPHRAKKWKKKQSPIRAESTEKAKTPALQVFTPESADYIIVDGYNVIFAWEDLSDLARDNIDGARDALLDIVTEFKSQVNAEVTVVFDAYRVKGHVTEEGVYQNINVVYTGQTETADQFIERRTNELGKKSKVAVVTSDGLEQVIARGQGCMLVSSREFRSIVENMKQRLREDYRLGTD